MLQRVPAATEAIRRIGSTEPAAMLFDAMEVREAARWAQLASTESRQGRSAYRLPDCLSVCPPVSVSGVR